MNSKSLLGAIEILRPLNGLMMMAVIAVAVILAGGNAHDWPSAAIAALVGAMVGCGANAINDYYDLEIDKVNKPNRPLPRGALTPRAAFVLWAVLSLLGISLNVFLHWTALCIAALAALILYWYSARLKGTVLLGNLTVASMTALAFLYGGVVAGHPDRSVVPAVFAFLINLGREIVKDIEDREGDRHGKAMTFPLKYGVRKSVWLATAVLVMLIAATIGAFLWGTFKAAFLVLALIADTMVAAGILLLWKSQSQRTLGVLSTLLKLSMVVGLGAIFFGS